MRSSAVFALPIAAALFVTQCEPTPAPFVPEPPAVVIEIGKLPRPAPVVPPTTVAVAPTTTAAPIDWRAYVNRLPYRINDPAPATEAYRIVAKANGWSKAKINAWQPFVVAMVGRESRYCPNLRRGAIVQPGSCVLKRQGRNSDAGFGQVIRRYFYGPGQWMCTERGICRVEQIVNEPWVSMSAVVWSIDRMGRQPWCYTRALRAASVCRKAPM